MNRLLSVFVTGIAAAFFALPTFAQGGGGGGGAGGRGAMMDCSKARNQERCEARRAATEACRDMRGREHRQCMREHMQAMRGGGGRMSGTAMGADCSRAADPQMCQQRQRVQQACEGKVGRDYMDCAANVLAPSASR